MGEERNQVRSLGGGEEGGYVRIPLGKQSRIVTVSRKGGEKRNIGGRGGGRYDQRNPEDGSRCAKGARGGTSRRSIFNTQEEELSDFSCTEKRKRKRGEPKESRMCRAEEQVCPHERITSAETERAELHPGEGNRESTIKR